MNSDQEPDQAMIDAWLAGRLSQEESGFVEKWLADQPDFSVHIGSEDFFESSNREAFMEDLSVAGREENDTDQIDDLISRISRSSPDSPNLEPLPGDVWREVIEESDREDILGTLGHYEVLEVIAIGGMGIVLKALDPELKRVAALKVLAPDLAVNATARERFLREARAAATLEHENILPIYGVVDEGVPWFAMRYASGGTLQDRLDRGERVGIDRLKMIALQVAEALRAAHANGIIHRDIKPANLLFDNDGTHLWVCDFGIARSTEDPGLTYPGAIAGTPKFMSPEQADGRPLDGRSDLFSLGAVLYQCATGTLVFQGSTTAAVLRELSADEPTRIELRGQELPSWFRRLLESLLAKDPDDRPSSAAAVIRSINDEHAPKPRRLQRRNRRIATAATGTVVGILLIFLLLQTAPIERAANALLSRRHEQSFFIAGRIGAHDGLADVVAAARDGDTILLPGGTPVAIDSLLVPTEKSLVFTNANPERRSVLTTKLTGHPGLVTRSPTQFRGVDFVVNAARDSDGILIVESSSVVLEDCRFHADREVSSELEDLKARVIELRGDSAIEVSRCDFDLRHTNAITPYGGSGSISIEDSRIDAYHAIDLPSAGSKVSRLDVDLIGLNFVGNRLFSSNTHRQPPRIEVSAENCCLISAEPLLWIRSEDVDGVRSRFSWIGKRNIFPLGTDLLQVSEQAIDVRPERNFPLFQFDPKQDTEPLPAISVAGSGETFVELEQAIRFSPDGATLHLSGHIHIPVGVEIVSDPGKVLNLEPHPKASQKPVVEALDSGRHGLLLQGDATVRGIRFVRRDPKRFPAQNPTSRVRPLLGVRSGMNGQALVEDCDFLVRRVPDLQGGLFTDGLAIANTGKTIVRRCFFSGGKAISMGMVEDASTPMSVQIEDCVVDSVVGIQIFFEAQPSSVDVSLRRSVFRGEKLQIAYPTTKIAPYRMRAEDCLFDISLGLLQFHGHDIDKLAGRIAWSGENNIYRPGIWTLTCPEVSHPAPSPRRLTMNDFEGLVDHLPGSEESPPRLLEIFDDDKMRHPVTPESLHRALRPEIESPAIKVLDGFSRDSQESGDVSGDSEG